jgi:FdrA protein
LNQLKHCTKSVIVNFLGEYDKSFLKDNILFTVTLEETAVRIAEEMHQSSQSEALGLNSVQAVLGRTKRESKNLPDTQKYIRGLFSGGSLAMEACITLRDSTASLFGNISLSGVTKLVDSKISQGHSIIDLGADEFTVGKPHPMLEPEMRKERLLAEAKDPEVAVILMDFVLGYGVHPDPVGATLPFIERAREIAQSEGRYLIFVGSVCGTDEDPQNKSIQIRMLEEQGVIVLPSNAQAARIAASIALPS